MQHALDERGALCARPPLPSPPREPALDLTASWARAVDEGTFWLDSGQSPYVGDARIVYHPPILLFMHSALGALPAPTPGFWTFALLALADVAAAQALAQLVLRAPASALRTAVPRRASAAAWLYLLNPQVVAPCVAGSTAGLTNAATLLSLSLAMRGPGASPLSVAARADGVRCD